MQEYSRASLAVSAAISILLCRSTAGLLIVVDAAISMLLSRSTPGLLIVVDAAVLRCLFFALFLRSSFVFYFHGWRFFLFSDWSREQRGRRESRLGVLSREGPCK